jgi:hypothetical protein
MRRKATSNNDLGGDGAEDKNATEGWQTAFADEDNNDDGQQRSPTPWPGRGRRGNSIPAAIHLKSEVENSEQEDGCGLETYPETKDNSKVKGIKRVRIRPFVSQAPHGVSFKGFAYSTE